MRQLSALRRTAAVVAAGAAMLAGVAAPAAATHPVTSIPFEADHRVSCLYMFTEGTMAFNAAEPGESPYVAVEGLLAVNALEPCELELGDIYAEFEAFVDTRVVDTEEVHLNPPSTKPVQRREYSFTMANLIGSADVPIEHVTVRVCRAFGPMLPAFSCGETVTVRPAGWEPQ